MQTSITTFPMEASVLRPVRTAEVLPIGRKTFVLTSTPTEDLQQTAGALLKRAGQSALSHGGRNHLGHRASITTQLLMRRYVL
jgi:hypothetical protein